MRAVEARDGAAVERGEQLAIAGGDQIDEMLVQRLLLGERLALTHGRLGQVAVAAALGADAAQVGRGIVLHLLLHDGIHLDAHRYRMRRAGVGARRHGGDIARFQQEEAGRCGAPAAGRNISDYRNRRRDDLFDGVPHGVHETSGSVEAEDHDGGIFGFRPIDCAADDFRGHGMHYPIHVHRNRFRGRGHSLRQKRKRHCRSGLSAQSTLTITFSDTTVRKLTSVIRLIETFDPKFIPNRLNWKKSL